jgi:feruloyl esterase
MKLRTLTYCLLPALFLLTACSNKKPLTELCSQQDIQGFAPADTTIVSAQIMTSPATHCRIEGYVTTTDPGPNRVDFRLQLPTENWTGRYYFIGLGGTGGYVPTDSQIPPGNPVVKGFAVAGTNTGHNSPANWSFLGENKAKAIDHAHRGGHVAAVSTQQITKRFYNVDDMYRYHSGCSGGGRMGMAALTIHPEDYDGILIGAPGMGPGRSTETMLGFIDMAQQMVREPGAWLSPAKLAMAEQAVTRHCDALDGAADDMIWDHNACTFDFNQLQCQQENNDQCLTEAEIRSINALLSGPQSVEGPIKPGFPISNMSLWSRFIGAVPPPWPAIKDLKEKDLANGPVGYLMANTLAQAYFGKAFNSIEDFDFNDPAMMKAWWAAADRVGYGQPFSLDITPFKNQGGKVIFWNGVSDPCCSDNDLEKYYREAEEVVGGSEAMQSFAKFYRVPGMGHCGDGTGPVDAPDRMLEKLIDWVENRTTPSDITVNRGETANLVFAPENADTVSGVPVHQSQGGPREFLLCPFPQISVFNGKEGGELVAKNWRCL